MKRLLSLVATTTIVLGIMATCAMSSTTALAGEGTTCQNDQSISGVQCIGYIYGTNPVLINIEDSGPLNNVRLNVLDVYLDNFLNPGGIQPFPPTGQQIADQVVLILEKELDVHTCTVVISEPNFVPPPTAQCH